MEMVYLTYWTLSLMPLMVYTKVLCHPNFSIKALFCPALNAKQPQKVFPAGLFHRLPESGQAGGLALPWFYAQWHTYLVLHSSIACLSPCYLNATDVKRKRRSSQASERR